MVWSLGSGNQQFYFGHGNSELQITHLALIQGRQLVYESRLGKFEAGDPHLVIVGILMAFKAWSLM